MRTALLRPFARHHGPAWMLVLACAFWGMGFSWAKNAGDAVNRAAGLVETGPVGPVALLTVRFGIAAALWLILVPAARRGWSWQTARRGASIGAILALGLILQHVGLGVSDESVIAFLTNLTVVFVPAWVLVMGRHRPKAGVLIAVSIAVIGTALLVGVRGAAPVHGAGWGIACAAAFAAEILLLDRLGRGESVARITFMMFLVTALCCGLTVICLPGVTRLQWQPLMTDTAFLGNAGLLIGVTTLGAFSIMTAFQPKVDPTRAAVLYLFEPLFAAAFAWWHNGRSMSADALAGAGLILCANIVAELRPRRVSLPATGPQ